MPTEMFYCRTQPDLNVIQSNPHIHPTAIISKSAQIACNVSIGPYSVIGEDVVIGEGCMIGPHVIIEGRTTIGSNNHIFAGSHLGQIPQDVKYNGETSYLVIGQNNTIREQVTISRGTRLGGSYTLIGNNNRLLTGTHVGHDVVLGDDNIIANYVQLGGHVVIDNSTTIGALAGVHQFVRLGSMAMIGANSKIIKDVAPFSLVEGNPARFFGINIERLRRLQYSRARRLKVKKAFHILFHSGLVLEKAIVQLGQQFEDDKDVQMLIDFLNRSERGIYRPKLAS